MVSTKISNKKIMKWNHEPGPTLSNSEEEAPIGYNSQIVAQ